MFSELVDDAVTRSGRMDKRAEIIGYANTILQKIHAKALWDRDFVTVRVLNKYGDNPNAIVWERPKDFRVMRTAKFGNIYLDYVRVGKHLEGRKNYYYSTQNAFVFCGNKCDAVDIGYYRRPIRFTYYPPNKRPAIYDRESCTFKFLVPSSNGEYADNLQSQQDEQLAIDKVMDWLLLDWYDVVIEGILNLVYTNLKDERQAGTFAIFRDGIKDIIRVEEFASTDN